MFWLPAETGFSAYFCTGRVRGGLLSPLGPLAILPPIPRALTALPSLRPAAVRLALLLLLLGGSLAAQAQYQVRGAIIDKDTQEPIPFAGVGVLGTSLGTASNAEGEFVLSLPSGPQQLIVSEIAHVRDTVAVAGAGPALRIVLASASVTLPEVKVASYAFQLVNRAYEHLQENYNTKFYGKAYYRQVTRIGDEPTELQEMIWNVKSNDARIEGVTTTQGRFAAQQALFNFSNFSFNTKAYGLFDPRQDTATSLALLSPSVFKNYYVELVQILENGDGNVAELSFETRPELRGYQAKGTVWVDADTYKVLRFRITTPNYTSASRNPNYKLADTQLEFDLVFKSNAEPVAPLDHIKVTLTADIVRPATPPKKLAVSSFTYFYDTSEKPTGLRYGTVSLREKDRETIRGTKYDPEFWANNPVVQRTPVEDEVIQAFEKKGAFGTMVGK